MNEVEFIRSLRDAEQKSGANPRPIGDVTAWVLDDIRRQESPDEDRRVWQFAAGFACVAALIAVVVGVHFYSALTDPFSMGLQLLASIDSPLGTAVPY